MTTPLSLEELQQQLHGIADAEHIATRLDLEESHHQHVIRWHRKFFHLENWYSIHNLLRLCLRIAGLLRRGTNNTYKLRVTRNTIAHPKLPASFHGFRILHLSDLHLDMDDDYASVIASAVQGLEYDACVLTGDYRANTFGDSERSMHLLKTLRPHLTAPIYAVLGNHDSIRMVPRLQDMGIRTLINSAALVERGNDKIAFSGVDDGHYFQLDDIAKTQRAAGGFFSIFLSHTPELFHQAELHGANVFLCGHTHGGQICLPGGIPLILEARCPRNLGKGRWQHREMQGYTSVGAGTSIINVRLNCPPEVTLHTLEMET